jgi:hypothetical protein
MPPECLTCGAKPAGATPRPASRTPHDAPFNWTRCEQCKRGSGRGDKQPLDTGLRRYDAAGAKSWTGWDKQAMTEVWVRERNDTYFTPSFFCRLDEEVVYWKISFLSG